ncbi:hypothetical protein OPFAMLBM_00091 [Aeromonas phage avDM12-TAAL]|nr:hypothetical protein OPFAMLBM_00091 [Aeromonas phage avDM12-TAAL]
MFGYTLGYNTAKKVNELIETMLNDREKQRKVGSLDASLLERIGKKIDNLIYVVETLETSVGGTTLTMDTRSFEAIKNLITVSKDW